MNILNMVAGTFEQGEWKAPAVCLVWEKRVVSWLQAGHLFDAIVSPCWVAVGMCMDHVALLNCPMELSVKSSPNLGLSSEITAPRS